MSWVIHLRMKQHVQQWVFGLKVPVMKPKPIPTMKSSVSEKLPKNCAKQPLLYGKISHNVVQIHLLPKGTV